MDIPSISAVVATVGVLVGITLAYLEVRTLVKTRQTDLLIRLHSVIDSREHLEAWEKVSDREITDLGDYKKKYGFVELNQLGSFYDSVGVLLRRKLIDIGFVHDLFGSNIRSYWEKIEPLVEEGRKQYKRPDVWEHFEYLYNEMQKREQQLQQTQQ